MTGVVRGRRSARAGLPGGVATGEKKIRPAMKSRSAPGRPSPRRSHLRLPASGAARCTGRGSSPGRRFARAKPAAMRPLMRRAAARSGSKPSPKWKSAPRWALAGPAGCRAIPVADGLRPTALASLPGRAHIRKIGCAGECTSPTASTFGKAQQKGPAIVQSWVRLTREATICRPMPCPLDVLRF